MNVLIYDPIHTGHHLNWVRLLIQGCQPYASNITFATTANAVSSIQFDQHLSPLAGKFKLDHKVEPIVTGPDRRFDGLRIARRGWNGLREAVQRNKPDHVFVSFADALLRAPLTMSPKSLNLGISPANVEGIIFEAPYGFRRELPWKHQLRMFSELAGLGLLPFGRLMLLAPLALSWLDRHAPSIARRCEPITDAIKATSYSKAAARKALSLPADGRMVGCIGVLDSRKGVDEFVDSFAASPLRSNDRLLLAGKASDEVLAAVARARETINPDSIILINHTLTQEQMDLALSAVDLVSVTYRFPQHVGMSSMLIRAVLAGRPVLSMPQGWPGYITRQLSLGWIYPEDAHGRLASIARSLDDSENFQHTSDAITFAASHSEENAIRVCTKNLRSRKRLQDHCQAMATAA